MSMEYIREHYGAGFKRGVRVVVRWQGKLRLAEIVGSDDSYLLLRLAPMRRRLRFHPNDIERIATPSDNDLLSDGLEEK